MKSVAYWTALDEPEKSSSFFYILEHPNREAAAANWKAFQDDPEWKAVKAKSEEKSVGLSPVHMLLASWTHRQGFSTDLSEKQTARLHIRD